MPEVTIKDVARAAQVSIATVSRVSNGNPRVDPELAERVNRAIEMLGYRPNVTARRLVAGRTLLVGALVPDLSNPFFPSVLRGFTAAAEEAGYSVVVAESGEHVEREMRLSLGLLAQTDALVLFSPRMDSDSLTELASQPSPTVCVNRTQSGLGMPCVTVDEYEGALCLAGHLAGLGHRRIAYLQGPPRSWSGSERWRALRAASAFGLEVEEVVCGPDLDSGFAVASSVIDSGVTAVVAFNDYVALGLLSGLRDLGVNVPGDLSVAGFDDIPFSAYTSPSITSIRRPVVELGQQAWQALEARLEGRTATDPPVLSGELICRESTSAPRPTAGMATRGGSARSPRKAV